MNDNDEMLAEPMVIQDGKVSDASEHLPLLSNPDASSMADELAIREAVASGLFTEEEARALMSGPEDLTSLCEAD